ncbi:MAG: hypothetical protein WCR71_05350, partial [Bacteroidales bacterium]
TIVLFLAGTNLFGQSQDALSTFTPYSVFGVGDINRAGTAYNKAMGGIGIGIRENRLINILNPASLTERDTLSFLLDFGVNQKNILTETDNAKSAYNVFNMHHIVMSFPIYKKSAFSIGIIPYSSVGYSFEEVETDPAIINEMGDIRYQRYGTGGINKIFLGASVNLFKNFSLGAEGIFYFGTIDRKSDILFNSDASYRTINSGMDYVISSLSAKLGAQYFKALDNDVSFTVGATWLFGSKLSGDLTKFAYATNNSGRRDTVYFDNVKETSLEIPSELGLGVSLRKKDKWLIGFDYTRQDWSSALFAPTPGISFTPALSNAFKVGFEYIPNRYDIRYYTKRITYRGGLYYENTYMKVADKQIDAIGITLGATLPILRLSNGVGFSVDLGQRGSLKNNLVRERYIMFNLNFSLQDIWFVKYKYD